MAHKRSRAAFEAELQAQQSPFVLYGTPLPPLDPDVRDDGSYVPVWKQEVTDERGRKRLHGAFTGGFSAGYFNTVGSKEGWTPSTFVSSKKDKNKSAPVAPQKPEDFMDEEDLADAEEAKKLETSSSFTGLGSTEDEVTQRNAFTDIFRLSGETMGKKLLRKMGWRDGQGVGSRVRRKARMEEDGEGGQEGDDETHLFAPKNSPMVSFDRKDDLKGLGFQAEGGLRDSISILPIKNSITPRNLDGEDEDESSQPSFSKPKSKTKVKSKSKPTPRTGFGVGILNDTGSDDEDPYSMGPSISYKRTIGSDKRSKKPKLLTPKPASNPLLASKPVFVSKKPPSGPGFQKCHDGRLPLTGFLLASAPPPKAVIYPPPSVPDGWTPRKRDAAPTSQQPTPANEAERSTLNPSSRGTLLGETPLPQKSVFSFLNPSARARIAAISQNENLPPAGSESLTPATNASGPPPAAPFPDNRSTSLFAQAGASASIIPRGTNIFANRFVSGRSEGGANATQPEASSTSILQTKPNKPPEDPAVAAARMGQFGQLTRSEHLFYPSRLLCKRFNIPVPAHVMGDPGGEEGKSTGMALKAGGRGTGGLPDFGSRFTSGGVQVPENREGVEESKERSVLVERTGKKKVGELLSGSRMEELLKEVGGKFGGVPEKERVRRGEGRGGGKVDVEVNEALEGPRAGEEVFRAVFGDSSDEE